MDLCLWQSKRDAETHRMQMEKDLAQANKQCQALQAQVQKLEQAAMAQRAQQQDEKVSLAWSMVWASTDCKLGAGCTSCRSKAV